MTRAAHLLALLDAFAPLDDAEAAHARMIRDLLAHGEACFGRAHYAPGHVTASAFVLDEREERLLLIWHGKLHRWLQPGGHVDDDDGDVVVAARREVREETAIAAPVLLVDGIFDVDVHEIPARPTKGEPAHLHFDVRFLFRAPHDAVQAGDDALDARFVALDEVHTLESDASVRRAVEKLRRRRR